MSDLFVFIVYFFVTVLKNCFLDNFKMDQGAVCPVCYQPPYFCLEVRDNTTHFSIKIVQDDFEDGVVSCYIFFQSFFNFFIIYS
jgi:hypothetical protein